MRSSKQKYLFSWIALGTMIAGGTLLLLLAGSEKSTPAGPLLLLIWVVTVAAAICLFILSSDRITKNIPVEQPSEEKKIRHIRSERKAAGKKEQFDISAIAGRIVRRLSPDHPPKEWGHQMLHQLVAELEVMSGIFYYKNDQNIFESLSTYAYPHPTGPYTFTEGEGLTGQAAKNRQVTIFRSIPDDYRNVFSGLGSGKPSYLAIVPILAADEPVAVIEIAGFRWAEENLEQLFQIIARELTEKINQLPPQGKTKKDGP
jgi:hypothetical protein